MPRITSIALTTALLATVGCASTFANPSGKQNALEESQKRYTELVRWGEIERASAFVDPELQEDFLRHAPALQSIRFTDYESGPPQFGEGHNSATVNVIYHAFSLATMVEKRIHERQEWYRGTGPANEWRVRPELREIVSEVGGND